MNKMKMIEVVPKLHGFSKCKGHLVCSLAQAVFQSMFGVCKMMYRLMSCSLKTTVSDN
jgi:hypothetical protein